MQRVLRIRGARPCQQDRDLQPGGMDRSQDGSIDIFRAMLLDDFGCFPFGVRGHGVHIDPDGSAIQHRRTGLGGLQRGIGGDQREHQPRILERCLRIARRHDKRSRHRIAAAWIDIEGARLLAPARGCGKGARSFAKTDESQCGIHYRSMGASCRAD